MIVRKVGANVYTFETKSGFVFKRKHFRMRNLLRVLFVYFLMIPIAPYRNRHAVAQFRHEAKKEKFHK